MNIQRLKFASARGARIQFREFGIWYVLRSIELIELRPDFQYRVHPDDAHLEYGPISSMLIKAIQQQTLNFDEDVLAIQAGTHSFRLMTWREERTEDRGTMDDQGMYCLFVAEYLADEGL